MKRPRGRECVRVGEKRGFDGVLPSRVERVINTLKERGKKGRERESRTDFPAKGSFGFLG